jgi:predicted alpha/beta hydrolase family esterase
MESIKVGLLGLGVVGGGTWKVLARNAGEISRRAGRNIEVTRVAVRDIARARLPFPAIAVISSDDPFCAPERARAMAADWGAETVDAGPRGHRNAASGLGAWPEGLALLQRLAPA